MSNSLISRIKNELDKIKFRYQQKYGAVIFDIKVKNIGEVIFLEGIVLSEKQKNETFLAIKDVVKDVKIVNKIKILGDPEENLEIGRGVVISEVADVWEKFPNIKKSIGRARLDLTIGVARPDLMSNRGWKRASQALKSEFVRVLARKNKWLLIQTRDLAIGWIDSSQIIVSKYDAMNKEWIKTKRAKQGKMIKKKLAKNIQSKFLGFLKKYLNAGYLSGGMTEKGIDCSGLTERFYSDIFGIMLPRHSSDQALTGEKIELKAAHFGDLVFLRNKTMKQAHIGAVVEKFKKSKVKRENYDNILILNARLEKGGAAIEDLSEILKSYNLISVKRIIK